MDALTIVALVIVFCLGTLAAVNIRMVIKVFCYDSMHWLDYAGSALVGLACAFLFFYFT